VGKPHLEDAGVEPQVAIIFSPSHSESSVGDRASQGPYQL